MSARLTPTTTTPEDAITAVDDGPTSPSCPLVSCLNFHGVGTPCRELEPGEQDFWISAESFEAILTAVGSLGPVMITVDDGNKSDVETVLPILQRFSLSATFFVVAGRVNAPGFLSADDIRCLTEAGMRIGSHGMTHRCWRGMTQRQMNEEFVAARKCLETVVGEPVDEAACPFGSYGRRVLSQLRQLGYRRVYTSDGAPPRPGAWLMSRLPIRRRHSAQQIAEEIARQRGHWFRRFKMMLKQLV